MFKQYPHKRLNSQPHTKNVGHKLWELVATCMIYFMLDGKLYRVVIKKGFRYDKASIPRLAWTLLGKTPSGRHDLGTILHDLLYMLMKNIRNQAILGNKRDECFHTLEVYVNGRWVEAEIQVSRKQADELMFQVVANTNGVDVENDKKLRRRLRKMYLGVRVGGSRLWKKSTEKEKINPKFCNN